MYLTIILLCLSLKVGEILCMYAWTLRNLLLYPIGFFISCTELLAAGILSSFQDIKIRQLTGDVEERVCVKCIIINCYCSVLGKRP